MLRINRILNVMNRQGSILLLLLSVSLAISACASIGGDAGITIKIPDEVRIDHNFDQNTLGRIDELTDYLRTGIEIGPETRSVIGELNQTLSEGVKAGFDEPTLQRIDALMRVIEDGLDIGIKPKTLQTLNDLIATIGEAPHQWESAATEIVRTLENSAGSAAKRMADEVERVMESARINTQQIVAIGGTELRCNVDFLGAKAGDTINAFIGRSLINRLKAIVTGRPVEPPIPTPWVCHVIPDQVRLRGVGERLIAEENVIRIIGFNYDHRNLPTVTVVDEVGREIPSLHSLTVSNPSPYLLQINLQEIDFSRVAARARLEFRWPNPPSRNSIVILLPNPDPPRADFRVDLRRGTVPHDVRFTDLSTGAPNTWFWVLGDGETSTTPHPTYTYLQPGSYTVRLTVSNAQGTDTIVKRDYVVVDAPVPAPKSNFSASSRFGTRVPHEVQFTDESTGDPTAWFWEFGDGKTSSAQHPVHRYISSGKYNVRLTVTNAQGSDIKVQNEYIVVEPPPQPIVEKFEDSAVGDGMVACPADSQLLGGGHIMRSAMWASGSSPHGTAWRVIAGWSHDGRPREAMTVEALCIKGVPSNAKITVQQGNFKANDFGVEGKRVGCSTGDHLLGGGYEFQGSYTYPTASFPDQNGWRVVLHGSHTGDPHVTIYAVCYSGSVRSITTISNSVAGSTTGQTVVRARAICPARTVNTGGGYQARMWVAPYIQTTRGNGWNVEAFDYYTDQWSGPRPAWNFTVYAVCVEF